MPLMPKRVKYRKSQRGSRKGTASRNLRINFGEFGLQTLERAWITNTQIEAARVALTRNMKRKGKLWIRIFPDKSVTARPPETRMGKGKGPPEFWVATVKPGNILFELDGLTESVARESLRLAADKLPVRTKFIGRQRSGVTSVKSGCICVCNNKADSSSNRAGCVCCVAMWRGLKQFFHNAPSNRSPFRPLNQSRRRRNNLCPSKHHKIDNRPCSRRHCQRSTLARRGRRGWAK